MGLPLPFYRFLRGMWSFCRAQTESKSLINCSIVLVPLPPNEDSWIPRLYLCACDVPPLHAFDLRLGLAWPWISDNFGIAVLVFRLLSSCPLAKTSSLKRSSDIWKSCAKQSANPYIFSENTIWGGWLHIYCASSHVWSHSWDDPRNYSFSRMQTFGASQIQQWSGTTLLRLSDRFIFNKCSAEVCRPV